MEITDDLCGDFDKTDGQWWNEPHVHYCYVTMWSICCHRGKSLAPVSRSVIGEWSHITKNYYGYDTCYIPAQPLHNSDTVSVHFNH